MPSRFACADNQWFTYFNDWVGTKRMEASQSGDMYEGYRSLPFGESLDWDYYGGPDVSYKQFTGQPLDFDSQLGNFGARDYKFGQSRFMTPDPSGIAFADLGNPQTLNMYGYAVNSPLVFIDPTGMWVEMDCSQGEVSTTSVEGGTVKVMGHTGHCEYINHEDYRGEIPREPVVRAPSKPVVIPNPCPYQGRALPPSAYAAQGQAAKGSSVNFALDVTMGFPAGDFLDPQPLGSGNAYQNQAYGNYTFGVYMQSAGVTLSQALSGANGYAAIRKVFNPRQYANQTMDPNYPSLPAASVANISNGFNAQASGTTCHN